MSRKRGEIKIMKCTPVTAEKVGVYFIFDDVKYSWLTSWRSGSDITHSINGDVFNVSFTELGNGEAKNVRVLKIEK